MKQSVIDYAFLKFSLINWGSVFNDEYKTEFDSFSVLGSVENKKIVIMMIDWRCIPLIQSFFVGRVLFALFIFFWVEIIIALVLFVLSIKRLCTLIKWKAKLLSEISIGKMLCLKGCWNVGELWQNMKIIGD